MTTIWSLPTIELTDLTTWTEERPTAVLTGVRSWAAVSSLLRLPIVAQAEPTSVTPAYLDTLATDLPPQVKVIYGVGGGMVADCAKYIGYRRGLPVVIIPTALSVDGFFTPQVAARLDNSVHYVDSGPAERVLIDWEVIRNAPIAVRGAAIVELLTIVTGILDWQYAAERRKNTPETRYQTWASQVMAGIAQQAFKISTGVGQGKVESLQTLLDLVCMEVRMTNQLGHTRPQEGSEQYFAYAIEPVAGRGRPMPYADLVAPGILLSSALHNQKVDSIRRSLEEAGVRLDRLSAADIESTLFDLPKYVTRHNLPYSIINDFEPTNEVVRQLLTTTGLG